MTSTGRLRRALAGFIATAAVVALGSVGIVPALADPADPAEAGFYVYGQNWTLPANGVSVAMVGDVTCASRTVSFRKASVTTALPGSGVGFPNWGVIYDYSIPAGLTGAGQIVVKCGGTDLVSIPFTIATTTPASLYHTGGQWTTLTDESATNFTVNKIGFSAGEAVRITPYDDSLSNEGDFTDAIGTPVTVSADGAGAVTASMPLPGTFSGDDYAALMSSTTSRIIYDTNSGDSVPTGTLSLTTSGTAGSGTAVAVSGEGYAAGENVVVALHSPTAPAVALGTLVASAGGTVSGSVTVPANTPAGNYLLWAGSKSVSYVLLNTPLTITNPDLANTALPAITGTASVGGTLTASKGTWATVPAPLPVFTYSWWRDGVVIPGATAVTYKPTAEDFAATLTVRVQAVRVGYGTTTAESLPTAPIGPGALLPAAIPTITGTVKVGSTLTAVPGVWAASTTFTYQWLAAGLPIVGATDPTLVLAPEQFGKKITVTVTGTKPAFTAARTSLPTVAVAAIPFVSTVAPVISGTPQVGVALSADPGTWSPAATYTYQWLAGGVAVAGATGQTFTPKAAQLGKAITVSVTGSAVGSLSAAKVSAPTAIVTLGAYSATPEPTVAGSALVGSTLTASTAGWDAGSTFAYRWYADDVPIVGAVASTYVPTATQVGEVITVRITTTTPAYPIVVLTSSVGSAPLGRGVFTTAPTPTITKTPAAASFRFGTTLTAVTGAWSPAATFTYQWYADGVAILGAEAATYKPTAAQVGAAFSVRVIGARAGFSSTARTSVTTPALEALTFTTTPVAASITGTAKLGVKLTAVVGTFTPVPGYAYQWFADGVPIDGATASTFTVTSAQPVGTAITVSVTGSLAGYTAATKVSVAKVVVP